MGYLVLNLLNPFLCWFCGLNGKVFQGVPSEKYMIHSSLKLI